MKALPRTSPLIVGIRLATETVRKAAWQLRMALGPIRRHRCALLDEPTGSRAIDASCESPKGKYESPRIFWRLNPGRRALVRELPIRSDIFQS